MKTILTILLFLQSFQKTQVHADTNIPLVVDYARFKAEGNWNYVELYLSIPRDKLEFKLVESNYEAQYIFGYEVYLGDSTVAGDSWTGVDRVDSLNAIQSGQRITDQASLFLPEGDYRIITVVRDLAGGDVGSFETELILPPHSKSHMMMSDIQLSLQISRTTEEGRFVKNGLRILPNPQGMYTMTWPVLNYYYEIYNLSSANEGIGSTYEIHVRLEADGAVIRELPSKKGNWSDHAIARAL